MYRTIGALLVVFVITLSVLPSFAQDTAGRLSVTDREIIERLTRLEEGQKALNRRMDDMGKRIDSLQGLIWVVLAGMFALVGFVIWDRKTALSPVTRKTKQLEEREDLIVKALAEYSRKQPELADVLRSVGLL